MGQTAGGWVSVLSGLRNEMMMRREALEISSLYVSIWALSPYAIEAN